jgi:hypothetical protein
MKRKYVVGGVLVLAVAVASFACCRWLARRPRVEIDSLLAQSPEFPTTWRTDTSVVESVDWQVAEPCFSQEPRFAFGASSNQGRTWTDGGGTAAWPGVAQRVFRYGTTVEAAWRFLISRPEIAWQNKWPNFSMPDRKPYRYSTHWDYRSRFADQEHVVCGMGVPEDCYLWFYWARYGQYLLEIRLSVPSYAGASAELFEQVVIEVEPFVGLRLENGR